MRVAPFRVVRNVRDHAGGDKSFPDPGAQQLEIVGGREDQRQGDLHLSCHLGVFAGLHGVDGVPEPGTVQGPCRRSGRRQYLAVDDFLLARVVVDAASQLRAQPFPGTISGKPTALAPVDLPCTLQAKWKMAPGLSFSSARIFISVSFCFVFGVQGVSPWRTIPNGNVEVRLYQKYLNPPTN